MKNINRIFAFLLVLVFMAYPLIAKETLRSENNSLAKSSILSTGHFDGNRIYTDLENDGMIVSHRITGHSGFEWPKGSGNFAIFASGLWMSGIVDGEIRTAAAEYAPEFVSGPYGSDGNDPSDVLYKVNKVDLQNPAANPDFANWPTDKGAPWVDNDNDGVYTPMPGGVDHPEFLGDQVMYYVMNDGVASAHSVFATDPMGLEIQTTIFGYNRNDAFGDMMFVKSVIINKGGNDITDAYLGIWSDPDLGDAGDDFVGCDTSLSLGITYNEGSDLSYGEAAPAVGYDFFQAAFPTGDMTDTAWAFGDYQAGYVNLPMSSFIKYINGDLVYTDPNDEQEAYFYMQGLLRDGSPITNSATGLPSKFLHPDDPNDNVDATDAIWVDSDDHASGDRRFLMNVGPFDFPAGGEAEVVFGIFMSQGADPLASITKLKEDDILAQKAYDVRFELPDSPGAPVVTAEAAAGSIVLEWGTSQESYSAFDNFTETYYEFEGYNVYQLENSIGTGVVKKIGSYDIVNGVTIIEDVRYVASVGANLLITVQEGTDGGIQHSIAITKDAINGGVPLIDDRAYYFAVTSYGYGELTEPHMLESPLNIFETSSQTNVTLNPVAELGDAFDMTHTTTTILSDGTATVSVTNPSAVTGDDYTVTFDTLTFEGETAPTTIWNLTNVTTGDIVLANQTVQGGLDLLTGIQVGSAGAATAEGLQVIVNGPSDGIHGVWQTANGGGPIAGIDSDVNENIVWINFLTAPDYPTSQVTPTDIGVSWFFVTHGGGTANDWDSFYARMFRNDNWDRAIPNDFEMRFTAAGSKVWMAYTSGSVVDVPFELWNVGPDANDTSDDFKMIAWVFDVNGNDVLDWAGDDPSSSADNDPTTDYIYWRNPTNTAAGTAGYDSCAIDLVNYGYGVHSGAEVIGRSRVMNWNTYASHTDTVLLADLTDASPANWTAADTAAFTAAGFFIDATSSKGVVDSIDVGASGVILHDPEEGTIFRWITNKPNSAGDKYTFSTAGYGAETVAFDPENIKVWPNPYFGYNPEERTPLGNEINFINLPEQATINIYTLAGQLVTTLNHDGGQEETWNAQNSFGVLVASGVYIANVQSDDGDKVLKLAVVMPQQRLDVY